MCRSFRWSSVCCGFLVLLQLCPCVVDVSAVSACTELAAACTGSQTDDLPGRARVHGRVSASRSCPQRACAAPPCLDGARPEPPSVLSLPLAAWLVQSLCCWLAGGARVLSVCILAAGDLLWDCLRPCGLFCRQPRLLAVLHPGIALPLPVRGITDCPVLLPDLLPDCGPSSPQLRHALSVIECT